MRTQRGFILPMGMVFACILVMLGMSFSSVADLRLRSAIRQMKQDDAQAAADGGLVAALQALAADTSYDGKSSPTVCGAYSSYTVQVFRPPTNVPEVGVVPPECIYVLSTGSNAGLPARTAGALMRRGSWITGVPSVSGSSITVRQAVQPGARLVGDELDCSRVNFLGQRLRRAWNHQRWGGWKSDRATAYVANDRQH